MARIVDPFTSYLTASELFGRPSSLGQLHSILRRFTPESLMQVTSWLAIGARVHLLTSEFSHQLAWLEKHLPRALALRIRQLTRNGIRPVFSRCGILTTARESIRVGDEQGASADSEVGVQQVMLAVLIAQDLVRPPPSSDKRIDLVAAILPYYVVNPYGDDLSAIGRNLLMIETLSEKRRHQAGFVDVAGLFQGATGLSVREYSQLMLAACTRFIKSDEAAIFAGGITLKLDYFSSSKIPKRAMLDVLRGISCPLEQFRPKLAQDPLSVDFFEFEEHPLLRLPGDEFTCIDVRAMLRKAGLGLFWTMHTHHGRRNDVKLYWGALFEDYVGWLMMSIGPRPRLSVLPQPMFKDGSSAGDFCIYDEHRIAILELKASTMPRRAKDGDPRALEDDLIKKIIKGDGGRKGVAQLLYTQSKLAQSQSIVGVPEVAHKRKFYPSLVFLDDTYTSIGIKTILAVAFQQKRVLRGAVKTTRLFALSIEDLEHAVNAAHSTDFFSVLEDYYLEDPDMSLPLDMTLQSKYPTIRVRSQQLETVVRDLVSSARTSFFDEPAGQH